jgi:phosphatidylserine decarboxylase precursor
MDVSSAIVTIVATSLCVFIAPSHAAGVTVTRSAASQQSAIYRPSTKKALTRSEFLALDPEFTKVVKFHENNYTYSQLSTGSVATVQLYAAQPKGCGGFVYYLGKSNTGGHFTCQITLYVPATNFTCTNSAGNRVAMISSPVKGDSLSAEVYDAVATTVIRDGLMSWILVSSDHWDAALASISKNNIDRHAKAKDYVGGIYFLIAVGMAELVVLGTLWMNWLWQPVQCEGGDKRKNRWRNLVFWFVLILLTIQLVSILGGFMGWVISGSLLFLFIISMNFIVAPYLVYRCGTACFQEVCCDYGIKMCFGGGDNNKSASDLQKQNPPPEQLPEEMEMSEIQPDGKSKPQQNGTAAAPHTEMPEDEYKALWGAWLCLFLTIFICMIVFFPGWTVDEYTLWDRQVFTELGEFQPSTVAKALQMMYAWDRMATDLKFNTFAVISTDYCQTSKRADVDPDDRKADIYDEFIDTYAIDMTQYDPSNYMEYTSANHWFIRKLAPGARSICSLKFPAAFPRSVVAPADARVMAWQSSMPGTRYWVKNNDVEVGTMLGSVPANVDVNVWVGGPLVVFRLAPQDYHRFHSPVSGTVSAVWEEGGSILSVSADAATSDNKVFLNTRKIIIIDSTCCGKVAYVAIGATCVGSVVLYKDADLTTLIKAGDQITAGDQLGIMQFGGSTVVMLFEPGKIQVDQDILHNTGSSSRYAETYIQLGEPIGTY